MLGVGDYLDGNLSRLLAFAILGVWPLVFFILWPVFLFMWMLGKGLQRIIG